MFSPTIRRNHFIQSGFLQRIMWYYDKLTRLITINGYDYIGVSKNFTISVKENIVRCQRQ